MLKEIAIGIPVRDITVSTEWYTRVLDAQFSEVSDTNFATFRLPGLNTVDFMLMRVDNFHPLSFSTASKSTACVLNIDVTEARQLHKTISENGVRVFDILDDDDSCWFNFEDIDGNLFSIAENYDQ